MSATLKAKYFKIHLHTFIHVIHTTIPSQHVTHAHEFLFHSGRQAIQLITKWKLESNVYVRWENSLWTRSVLRRTTTGDSFTAIHGWGRCQNFDWNLKSNKRCLGNMNGKHTLLQTGANLLNVHRLRKTELSRKHYLGIDVIWWVLAAAFDLQHALLYLDPNVLHIDSGELNPNYVLGVRFVGIIACQTFEGKSHFLDRRRGLGRRGFGKAWGFRRRIVVRVFWLQLWIFGFGSRNVGSRCRSAWGSQTRGSQKVTSVVKQRRKMKEAVDRKTIMDKCGHWTLVMRAKRSSTESVQIVVERRLWRKIKKQC